MKPIRVNHRPNFIFLSLVAVLGVFMILPVQADEESIARTKYYHSMLSNSIDPLAAIPDLVSGILSSTGSSFALEAAPDPSVGLLVARDLQEGEELLLLIVVDLNHVEDSRWSLAVWLAMLEKQMLDTESGSAAFSILPRFRPDTGSVLEAGNAFWLTTDPYQSIADLSPQAVILLDIVPEAPGLRLEAETRGRLSPLYVLNALRYSLDSLDLAYSENVVKALYARAGLIDGTAGLIPWLELGVPASRLYGRLDGQFQLLPTAILQYIDATGENWSEVKDKNYLRYQLPAAVVSLDDVGITRVILLLLGAFMASMALKPLFTRRHPSNPGPGVLPEALVAYLFSFIAVSISWLIHGFAADLIGSGVLTIDLPPIHLAIGIVGRLGSTMLFFIVLSGLSSRLGLLPHAVRGTASQAAAMIAGILGISVLYYSIQGSLLLFGTMILISLAGFNAAVAVLSISVLIMILLPLVLSSIPVFIPGLVTILNAQGIQLLLLAGFAAPIALWILTTLSPRHRLVRGDKTAPYLVVVAVAICFLDPWLRTRL